MKPSVPDQLVTVPEILKWRAATEPDRLVFAERDTTLTFAQLLEQATSIGSALVEAGARGGDRIAVSMAAGLDFNRVFWAVQLLGATSCALNPYTPAATSVRRAARVRPSLLVTDSVEVAREAATAGMR